MVPALSYFSRRSGLFLAIQKRVGIPKPELSPRWLSGWGSEAKKAGVHLLSCQVYTAETDPDAWVLNSNRSKNTIFILLGNFKLMSPPWYPQALPCFHRTTPCIWPHTPMLVTSFNLSLGSLETQPWRADAMRSASWQSKHRNLECWNLQPVSSSYYLFISSRWSQLTRAICSRVFCLSGDGLLGRYVDQIHFHGGRAHVYAQNVLCRHVSCNFQNLN